MICADCTYWDDYLEPGKCYVDLEYHEAEDTCDEWLYSLRAGPLDPAPLLSPDELLKRRVAEQDQEVEW
jgi:hypothetical protein